ncbi:MAG: translation initiation factor Sui1 [Mariprofundaceae bacterium]
MASQNNRSTSIVYSTEQGRFCSSCGKPTARCVCKKKILQTKSDGIVRVRREIKGRRGKTVTTVSDIPAGEQKLLELAKQLKRRCGTGGSAKEGVIVIQGDHRETIVAELKERGYTVKLAGG